MPESIPAFHSHLCLSDHATSANTNIQKPIQLDAAPSCQWKWEGMSGVGNESVLAAAGFLEVVMEPQLINMVTHRL